MIFIKRFTFLYGIRAIGSYDSENKSFGLNLQYLDTKMFVSSSIECVAKVSNIKLALRRVIERIFGWSFQLGSFFSVDKWMMVIESIWVLTFCLYEWEWHTWLKFSIYFFQLLNWLFWICRTCFELSPTTIASWLFFQL